MDDLECQIWKCPGSTFQVAGIEGVFGDNGTQRNGLVHGNCFDPVFKRPLVYREGDLGVVHPPLRYRRPIPTGWVNLQPSRVQQFDLPIEFPNRILPQGIDGSVGTEALGPPRNSLRGLLR